MTMTSQCSCLSEWIFGQCKWYVRSPIFRMTILVRLWEKLFYFYTNNSGIWLMRVVFLFKYFIKMDRGGHFCTDLRRCIITLPYCKIQWSDTLLYGSIWCRSYLSYFTNFRIQICNKIFCKIRTCMCNDLNNSLHHVHLINMNREKYRYIIFKAICVAIFTSDLSIHYWKLSA